jgi:hypothetical protein
MPRFLPVDGFGDWSEDPDLENEFGTKLVIVAGWCDSHADQCPVEEREEWKKFAAFLRILGGNVPYRE